MTAFVTAFVLVGLAEMADKTQLLTLCLACRYPARKVMLGVALAIAILNAVAVGIGDVVGSFLPVTPVKIGAGILFIGFGLWSLLSRNGKDESCELKPGRSPVLATTGAFLLAELGDKTQIATLSLGARFGSFFLVWLGASLAMILANALAIGGGTLLGTRLPQSTLKRISGGLFILFGIWTLAAELL